MTSSSLTPEDVRAAAETHDELGREYHNAVIESFLDKIGQEIDARVDARLAAGAGSRFRAPAPRRREWSPTTLAFGSLICGIPISAIVAYSPAHLAGLLVVWAAIAVINVAYAIRFGGPRPPPGHR